MYISKDELNIMIEVEELLHKKLEETNGIKDFHEDQEYTYFNEDDEEYELWCKYWNIIENLIQRRDKTNAINSKRIRDKRVNNKFYGRSKKEIKNMLKAELKREER